MAYQEVASEGNAVKAVPEYMGRKGQGPMDPEDLAAVVRNALAQSVQFIDTELSVERARATEYYLGKPFGNEEDGRSQAILTEVRDACDGMLPSFMREFFGPEHAVEFVPQRMDDVQQAEQATDYIRYVIEQDNGGFLRIFAAFKDALIRKIGIIKWYWDDSEETRAYCMEGVTKQQMKDLLMQDDDIEITKTTKCETQDVPGETLYDIEVTRTIKGGRARFVELPPEEFIYNRQARSIDSALIVGHRTDKTRGELIAMGVKEDDIDAHGGPGNTTDITLRGNAEEIARRDIAGVGRVVGFGYTNDPEMGRSNAKILYTEAWMTVDYDGDGIAELRKICCVGPTYYPVSNVPADERPFAICTPYPEPHTILGGSVADRTMDVQRINSSLLRGMLDSLAGSIFPRTAYQEGSVNVPDIMNTAIGAPIRVRGDVNAAIRPIEVPFTGKEALPIIQYMEDVVERRTSRNKGVAGLEMNALQSTTEEGTEAVLTGSQEQLELMCRLFAEQMMKPLALGLYKMLVLHQPRKRVVKLRGQWVDVDPRAWEADFDVRVNVCLGTNTQQKIQTLTAVIQDQGQILQTLGPQNPIVTLAMWRNAKAKVLQLSGIQDVNNYYKPVDPNWQPPAPPPTPPDPAVLAIQAEHEMNQNKILKELAIKKSEMIAKAANDSWEQQFKIWKEIRDDETKRFAISSQFHTAMIDTQLDAAVKRDVAEAETMLAAHDQIHDQTLEAQAQDHSQMMDQVQAAQAAQQPDEGQAGE